MVKCANCGQEMVDGARYCTNCGNAIAVSGAQEPSSSQTGTKDNGLAREGAEVKSSLQGAELWSWLKKDDRRQLFFLGDQPAPSESSYMAEVNSRLRANEVPAEVVKKEVVWDRGSIKKEMYVVETHTDEVNPLTCSLQFQQVGKFSFVEQKTYLCPPDLPEPPAKRMEMPDTSSSRAFMIAGFVTLGIGFAMMNSCSPTQGYSPYGYGGGYGYGGAPSNSGSGWPIMLIIASVALFYFAWNGWRSSRDVEEHNRKVDKQVAMWNKAWDEWEDKVFVHSFQESMNGQVTRVFQSVFECIKQVNDDLFKDVEKTDERSDTTMFELESQISRRKASYR